MLTQDDWQNGSALKFHDYVRTTRAARPHLHAEQRTAIDIDGGATRLL